MEGPDEAMPVLRRPHHRHPHQGRLIQRERPLPIGLAVGRKPILLLRFRETAPVVPLQPQAHFPMHRLQRLLDFAPVERSTQDGIPVDDPLPCPLEGVDIQPASQRVRHGDQVHAGVRRGHAVEQHALLHRRQLVEILEVAHRMAALPARFTPERTFSSSFCSSLAAGKSEIV